jgi:hypothetical protein
MKSTMPKFAKMLQVTVASLFAICATSTVVAAQGPEPFTAHIDWAAQNTDAGGSVDCPDQYISNGVAYAIASGGRAAAINQALFDAYHRNFDHAFTLVLMTQCHNPSAQQVLLNAGEKAVLTYLVMNYQPTGIDPTELIMLAQTALSALEAM